MNKIKFKLNELRYIVRWRLPLFLPFFAKKIKDENEGVHFIFVKIFKKVYWINLRDTFDEFDDWFLDNLEVEFEIYSKLKLKIYKIYYPYTEFYYPYRSIY